jgi:hypothetical protein
MAPSALDARTIAASIVVPLSPDERERLDIWALAQEREASQAVRWILRRVLASDSVHATKPGSSVTPGGA